MRESGACVRESDACVLACAASCPHVNVHAWTLHEVYVNVRVTAWWATRPITCLPGILSMSSLVMPSCRSSEREQNQRSDTYVRARACWEEGMGGERCEEGEGTPAE